MEIKPGLSRIRALCAAFGNPQDKLRFVHVAGTNGKGSIVTMVSHVLKLSGYVVGKFTSPYLVDFCEKIEVNGEQIPPSAQTRIRGEVLKVAKELKDDPPTEFEITTAMAFCYFAECKCDIVVLEVGLGGTLDSTNIIKAPDVCAISSISFDHENLLGNSLKEIAREKAGIIKEGADVVVSPWQHQEVRSEIGRIVGNFRKINLVESQVRREELMIRTTFKSTSFVYCGVQYNLVLPGVHQVQNCITVIEICKCLEKRGFSIDLGALPRYLNDIKFAGRLEIISENPLIILDGAHNIGGFKALCEYIDTNLGGKRVISLVGMLTDKAYRDCIDALAKRVSGLVFTKAKSERAVHSEELASGIVGPEIYFNDDLDLAAEKAEEWLQSADALIITGSLYLLGDAKKIMFCGKEEMVC
ncbi:MAG: bifunctional folylpolyglutamate synthase/dihydrofolate synthase [Oscillospiraceae bacterium]|jgi:dihydrofolate synthase/folylpolyglutamate synthase|nr:bifunctional folylpolyglutamate synthase/dihydrofolate synthase [Oscillospiraceae bacterium]